MGVSDAEDQRVAAGPADHAGEHAGRAGRGQDLPRRRRRARPAGSGPGPRRTTSRRRCRRRRASSSDGTHAAGQAHLGRGHGETAVGQVVAGADLARGDPAQQELAGAALGGEVDRRRGAVVAVDQLAPVERAAEPAQALAEQDQRRGRARPRRCRPWRPGARSRRGRRHWASAGSRCRRSRCRARRCRTRPGSRAPCRPRPCPRCSRPAGP